MSHYSSELILQQAVWAGAQSPCSKSKRGVVIWDPYHGPLSWGFNAPPHPFKCGKNARCKQHCRDLAVHAEQAAILQALERGVSVAGMDMLHVKVVNGEAVPSGPPSCVRCSLLILRSGISRMWLLHEDGLRQYAADEFHRLSLAENDLPFTYTERA